MRHTSHMHSPGGDEDPNSVIYMVTGQGDRRSLLEISFGPEIHIQVSQTSYI